MLLKAPSIALDFSKRILRNQMLNGVKIYRMSQLIELQLNSVFFIFIS